VIGQSVWHDDRGPRFGPEDASTDPMPPLEDRISDPAADPRDQGRWVIRAAGALDADGLIAPAVAILDQGRVTAVGRPSEIGAVPDARVDDRPGELLLPVLVNAHVHLDLWSVGAVSIDEGFDRWLTEVRDRRPSDDDAIRRSVSDGISASIAGGVGAVGDIAGAFGTAAAAAFEEGPLAGTSFIEVFGIGRRREAGLEAIARLAAFIASRPDRGRLGISPHAPYSCHPDVYAAAAATGLPLATHLAETPEEAVFTRFGDGPFVDLLRRVGSLGPEDAGTADGRHPIDLLAAIRPARPWLAAHVNYPAEPDEPEGTLERRAETLRECGITVVWCPRAARFLGHPREGRETHPWRLLRSRGVRVALGTDGRPCLDRGDRLTTLDDVRAIIADGAEPATAVSMATVDGAEGLGLDPNAVRFRGGAGAGLLGLPIGPGDPVQGLVESEASPNWLVPLRSEAFVEHRRGGA
jgi:cytosine/adenosine deaminase-related metal-dependent hydrolase